MNQLSIDERVQNELNPLDPVEFYSADSESSVIGCLLVGGSDSFAEIIGKLSASDFFINRYREVFSEIEAMYHDRIGIDLVTVAERLGEKRLNKYGDGLQHLSELYENTPTAANIVYYAGFIRDKAVQRKLVSIGRTLAVSAQGITAKDDALRELMSINSIDDEHSIDAGQMMQRTLDHIDAVSAGTEKGISTSIDALDRVTGTLRASKLIVLGARPSHGKTALILNIIENYQGASGFISTEQPANEIGSRLIAINSRIDGEKIRDGKMEPDEWSKLSASAAELKNRKIFINDQAAPTLDEVASQARKWKHENDIKILFVDYLQRISDPKQKSLREEVTSVTRGMKTIARELDIPVVLLAQVNREVDKRPNKRPNMADLMESGAIEAEADIVMLLYRDDVYGDDSNYNGIAEIFTAKNRDGRTGIVYTAWVGQHTRFENLSKPEAHRIHTYKNGGGS